MELRYDEVAGPPFLAIAYGSVLYDSLEIGAIAVLSPQTIQTADIDYMDGSGDEFIQHTLPVYRELKNAFDHQVDTARFEYTELGGARYLLTCSWYEPAGEIALMAITFVGEKMIQLHATGRSQTCDVPTKTFRQVLASTIVRSISE